MLNRDSGRPPSSFAGILIACVIRGAAKRRVRICASRISFAMAEILAKDGSHLNHVFCEKLKSTARIASEECISSSQRSTMPLRG